MKQIILDLTQKNIELEITEDSEIIGVFVGTKDMIIDTNINLIHNAPHIQSRTNIRALLFDNAKFNILCNLIINKGAKETDAYFKIDALKMSSESSAIITPSLEIMEDDVKGGHGATVGQINADQLNYLLTRGLDIKTAKQLIVFGFVRELIEKIQDIEIKDKFLKEINNV
jgi:Fe-S cluster assembly protein SufD